MNFGIYIIGPNGEGTFKEEIHNILREVKLAEKLGFKSVFVAEHHGYPYVFASPLLALAQFATVSKHLVLGAGVCVAPFYHPLRLAEDSAILDQLCGGRFILGLGNGYSPAEFEAFGVPLEERAARLKESVEVMRMLWKKENVSYNGKYYKLKRARLAVRPDIGSIPIWIGAQSVSAASRAARIADGFLGGPSAPAPYLSQFLHAYSDEARRLGKKTQTAAIRHLYVAPDNERALKDAGQLLGMYYEETFRSWKHPVVTSTDKNKFHFEDQIGSRFIVGSPEKCIDQIARLNNELGLQDMIFWIRLPRMTHNSIKAIMELLGRKVIPYFEE